MAEQERDWHDDWIENRDVRWAVLVQSFGMTGLPGMEPWDADACVKAFNTASHGEQHVISFLVNVWDPGHEWPCGKFDMLGAMATWDQERKDALVAWATNPWWP